MGEEKVEKRGKNEECRRRFEQKGNIYGWVIMRIGAETQVSAM